MRNISLYVLLALFSTNVFSADAGDEPQADRPFRACVIGGGLAGTNAAIELAKQGIEVKLIEQREELLLDSSRIPAHLYSGVMYAEKGAETVRACMIDAIMFGKKFPNAINRRPTMVALTLKDERNPELMIAMASMNRDLYRDQCEFDPENMVFGDPDNFFQTFTREQLVEDCRCPWGRAFCEVTNLDELQFPVLRIEEYGLNMRHMYGQLTCELESLNVPLLFNTTVTGIEKEGESRVVTYLEKDKMQSVRESFDIVVDGSGRNKGQLEAKVVPAEGRSPGFVDIKLAGLFANTSDLPVLPEIYILGGFGTAFAGKDFMSHISPVNPNVFVINVTTPECTYVAGGKKELDTDGKFQLCDETQKVLDAESACIKRRTDAMLEHLSVRHPAISSSLTALGGIPGSVDILGTEVGSRTSSVVFKDNDHYASLQITKGSAAYRVAENLVNEIQRRFSIARIVPVSFSVDETRLEQLVKGRFLKDGIPEDLCFTFNDMPPASGDISPGEEDTANDGEVQ